MARILVVEDEPAIAIGLQDDLEMEGYEVQVASDGAAGFKAASTGAFDLIILDIMLPKKDGYTICRELRAAGIRTPIIMLTARGQEIDRILGLDLGADDYVVKPFSPRELAARVRAVLRRGEPVAPAVLRFGNVEVDFARHEATRAGARIDLTATEFRLLKLFAARQGQALSIQEILDEVWGKDVFLTERVVYTHVNNLRAKIEENPAEPRHLVNIRGAGYRFDS